MKTILVAYATMAGSTAEVARAVGDEIAKHGARVDVLPIDQVGALDGYDGVVVGGPMILGWHRAAAAFLRRHRAAFQHIPLAVLVLAETLTRTRTPAGDARLGGVPIILDEALPKPPARPGHLSLRERYALPANYIRPVLAAIQPAKPVNIALFGGRLEYGRLKWWAVLFAMFVIQAPAGDRRNWPAIRAWAAALPAALHCEPEKAAVLA